MAGDPDEAVQGWLDGLSFKVKRELARTIQDEAEGLRAAIADAAPKDEGNLAASVQVRRKRNTLEVEVTAGGDLTTREVREGSGVSYDYALAIEYGTSRQEAQPFFEPTWRAREGQIRENIEAAVNDALSKA